MNLACPVRCDNDNGWVSRFVGAQFRDGNLVICQEFQQESFELFVGPIELVNQKHRRSFLGIVDGLKQRALYQEFLAE